MQDDHNGDFCFLVTEAPEDDEAEDGKKPIFHVFTGHHGARPHVQENTENGDRRLLTGGYIPYGGYPYAGLGYA